MQTDLVVIENKTVKDTAAITERQEDTCFITK